MINYKMAHIKAFFWCTLYALFVLWVSWGHWTSLIWLILLPIIYDMFVWHKIPWTFWRRYKDTKPVLFTICSWIDAILFALVAVYFINLYIFQNYQIPSSSLEKSLCVGDFLYVSKAAYGPRIPNTPLSMPLVQHTMPQWLGGSKSYIEHPHWDYRRLPGWRKPQKGEIVVFNFPTGDTVCSKVVNPDYYTLCHYYGTERVRAHKEVFGDILVRPVDRRENYVKRCVATPGDSLKIVDGVIYIRTKFSDWTPEQNHPGLQYNYIVRTDGHILTASYMEKIGISKDDRLLLQPSVYHFPLTNAMKDDLSRNEHVISIELEGEEQGGDVYPLSFVPMGEMIDSSIPLWTRDNYGPVYLPHRGETIRITPENYRLYRRIATAYEFQPMIIGQDYTFSMDYYWMMGDNRHNSADSRYWGFVPEDHIVGTPRFIWLSINKDAESFLQRIRWSRIGMSGNPD